jgi:hypothetical protein
MEVDELRQVFRAAADDYFRHNDVDEDLAAWIVGRMEFAAVRAAREPERMPDATAAAYAVRDFLDQLSPRLGGGPPPFDDDVLVAARLRLVDLTLIGPQEWPWPFGDG